MLYSGARYTTFIVCK